MIPGLNDSNEELNEIAGFIKNKLGEETPWHVSAFRPTYKMLDRPATPPETLIRAREIGLKAGLKYVYSGNIPIPGAEDTYCPLCQKPLIMRRGYLIEKDGITAGRCNYCHKVVAGVWSAI